jgi:hypothetical protein
MSSAALLLLLPFLRGAGGEPPPRPGQDALLGPAPEEPFSFGWLVRAFLTNSPEEAGAPGVAADASGFVLEDLDGYLAGAVGELAWRLGVDLDQAASGGELVVEDAYARWQTPGGPALVVGRFKARVVRSGSVPSDGLLFRERTFLGAAFDRWDDGLELGGLWDEFGYALALTDGANGEASEHFLSARGVWALVDEGMADREGAQGAPDHLRVVLGGAFFHDDALSDGGFAADLAFTYGPYGFHGEWASLGDDFTSEIDVFDGHRLTLGNGNPFSATLSRCLGERTEVGLRFQSADESDATEAFGLCASYTPAGGSLRLVADLELVEGDTRDFSLFTAGVQLGSSGRRGP